MESTLRYFSPKTPTGSLISSAAAHVAVFAAVVLLASHHLLSPAKMPVGEVEMDYEMLEEPPAPAKEVRRMARSQPAKAPEAKPIAQAPPHELQDEKSTVAGAQTAPKAQAAPGSDSNGDALAAPYYKVKPKYPRAALVTGDEGWVLMKIDITEAGEVENIRVVDGIKRSLFEDEARRAVSKWKYKPFTDAAGRATRKADHWVKVEFKLQDAES